MNNHRLISDIYPPALEKTIAIRDAIKDEKESIETGVYTSLSPNGYQLWSLKNISLIIENPNKSEADAIFPPHPESVYMSYLIPNITSKKKFLDVGIGTGILSIIASKKGWQSTGVDVNERAIQFATMNSILNNVECIYEKNDLGNKFKNNDFDFCIANLPFEPTPFSAKNFIHSNGGEFGDDLVKSFIGNIDNILKPDGICIVPSFSLIKDNTSRIEFFLDNLKNKKLDSVILRISKPIPLSLLSTRFNNDKDAYVYLEEEGYINFTIDIAIFKKLEKNGRFLGVSEIEIADKSWIMPSGWKGIGQIKNDIQQSI